MGESGYEKVERILTFVDCSNITGSDIADMISKTMNENDIPITECDAQEHDNGVNMAGKNKGTQVCILQHNPLAIFHLVLVMF